MLAGQAADQARQIRIACQVVVPEGLMASFADSVEAVTTPVVQCRAECRLASGHAQQQGFGAFAMTIR